MNATILRAVFLLALLDAHATAQTLTAIVRDGDVVTGVGNITSIENLAVNAAGAWVVEADTDNPNGLADYVTLRNGVLFLREGDPVALPAGATVGAFDGLSLNAGGVVGWNLFLDGLTTTSDSGVFYDTALVIQEGSVSTAPQFGANTVYTGFFDARINDANLMFLVASVDDPLIAGTTNRALVLVQVAAGGALVSENVISKQGDLIPGEAVETVDDFGTAPHTSAFNTQGRSIFFVDLTGTSTTDGLFVMADAAPVSILAREGTPSPINGRNYDTLAGRPVDINDASQYVMRVNLDGSILDDELILRDSLVVIAREGFGPTSISPFTLTGFGTGALRIDAGGNTFWLGDWNDPDTTRDVGIFRNDQLIVQEGVTTVGGQTIQSISTVQDNFTISPDGRYLLFECKLQGGVDAAVLLDLNGVPSQAYCFGDGTGTACPCGNVGAPGNGCPSSLNANGANLAASGPSSLANDTLVLSGTGMPNSSALYFQGTTQVGGGSGAVFGDGLRCAAGSIVRLKTVMNLAGASQFPGPGDPSVSVRGMVVAPGTRTYQVWYRNAAAFCNPETFNLTNGVLVTWTQ